MSLVTPRVPCGRFMCVGAWCPVNIVRALHLEGVIVNVCPAVRRSECPYKTCPVQLAYLSQDKS
ncbi:MAG: hypothetical protein NVS1B2_27340 [Vulcanimicrobiaceae bacterium]